MREIHTEVTIAAPAERVWRILLDFAAYPEWNPLIPEARGAPQVGERLAIRMAPPGGRAMTIRPRVTLLEPGRLFQWTGHLGIRGLFDGTHTFELEPPHEGSVRFRHREEFTGFLVPLVWGRLHDSVLRGFEAMNEVLKARAEAPAF